MPSGVAGRRRNLVTGHRVFLIPAILVVVGALILRLPGLDRSLWLDESWVANSILAKNWHDMFYYDAWSQSTPPLFLAIVRAIVSVVGPSEIAFRILPLAMAVAATILFLVYSRELFGEGIGIIAAVVFAFSHLFTAYSQELKHYTSDLAVAVWILLLLWKYSESGSLRFYCGLIATFVVAPFLSFTAVLYLPLALLVILFQRNGRSRAVILILVAGSVFAACYAVFIRPNSTANLRAYYEYPNFAKLSAVVHYYLENTAGLFELFVPLPSRMEIPLFIAFLGAAGASVAMALRPRPNWRQLKILSFSLVPIVTLIGANAVHQYPYATPRTSLFVLPCIVSVALFVADTLWNRLKGWIALPHVPPRVRALAASAFVLIATAVAGYGMAQRSMSRWEDAKYGVRYMRNNAAAPDLVYVHASSIEPFKFYSKVYGQPAGEIVFGDTGWPCCSRYTDLVRANEDPRYFVQDFESKALARGHRRVVWLIYTGRRSHFPDFTRRMEPVLMRAELERRGCLAEPTPRFQNFLVDRYRCP
jgi:hypothetical protein